MRIVKNVAKRLLSLTLAALMVLAVLPITPMTVEAAEVTGHTVKNLLAESDSGWSANGSTFTGAVASTAQTKCGEVTGHTTKTATLTLKNNGTTAARLSFTWSTENGGSVNVAGSKNLSGSYSAELNAGASITISVTSHSGNAKQTKLTLTGVALVVAGVKYDVTFNTGENGSYKVGNTVISASTKYSGVDSGTQYTLTATPASGYILGYWADGDGKAVSYDNPSTITVDKNITIKPVFIKADAAKFGVGAMTFFDLNEADAYATGLGGAQINLLNNGVLYPGDYTISSKNTLLIPFDDAYTCYTTDIKVMGVATGLLGLGDPDEQYVAPSVYRTLTMKAGANIQVNGVISVSAKANAGKSTGKVDPPNKCGAVNGKYGHIAMESGSNIVINNGGVLYAWGYITGSGIVSAMNGSKVYELMQVTEFRGGSILTDMANDPNGMGNVFPLSQYYVQNIETELRLYAGATEYGHTAILIKGAGAQTATPEFIGPTGMFRLKNGYVSKRYNGAEDRLYLDIYGEVELAELSISMQVSSTGGKVTFNSSNYVLPITNNITITAHSGKVTMTQNVALLPGSKVAIGEDAELLIEKDVYIYDATEWNGKGYVHGNANMAPITYAPSKKINRSTTLTDCVVDVNGKVTVNGYLYTTTSGAQIISSKGTGEILFSKLSGDKTITHQYKYPGETVENVPITPAKLMNANGSYTATAGAEEGTIFLYDKTKGIWYSGVTVTYNPNGGSGTLSSITDNWENDETGTNSFIAKNYDIDFGFNSFPLPTLDGFTRPGYTANGWKDSAGNYYVPGATYVIDPNDHSAITFYAQWEPKTITVTVYAEDGTTVLGTVTGKVGSTLTIPGFVTPTKAGYGLVWVDNTGAKTKTLPTTIPASDVNVTYKVTWDPNDYTVTFHANNGTSTTATQTVEHLVAEKLNANTFTRAGYRFLGWSTSANSNTVAYTDAQQISATGNLVLYAVWEEIMHTVTFNGNGADNGATMSAQTIGEANKVALNANPFTRTGYTFLGWSESASATTATYTDKQQITVSKDTVLYAVWKMNSYKLTFKDNKGNVLSGPTDISYGSTIQYPDANKTGYTFHGWDSNLTTMPAHDLVITGTWTANSYEITWNVDGVTSKTTVTYDSTFSLPGDPVKEGYTFLGWFTAETGGDQVVAGVYKTASNVTYYARFAIKTYTVTWVDESGNVVDTEVVSHGANATKNPTVPAKNGYTGAWEKVATNVTADVEIKPVYTANSYTITWLVDGKVHATTTVTFDSKIGTLPTEPVKEGYTFAGWYLGSNRITADTIYRTADDVEITAELTINQYKAVFHAGIGTFADGSTTKDVWTNYGEVPVAPAIPGKVGYSFAGWTPELTAMGVNGATYTATYTANDISYTVETYTMGLDGQYGEAVITTGSAKADSVVTLTPDAIEGFSVANESVLTGIVAADGILVLKVYYSRNRYTLTVDVDGEKSTTEYYYGATVATPTVPSKTGYTFAGWNPAVPATMPAENVTVTATWTINKYTVTWIVDGQETVDTYEYGATIVVPADPAKTGYTFAGWTPDVVTTMGAANVTYTATWTINKYTVTWIVDGQETVDTYEYGATIVVPADPAKTGYTFAGWTPDVVTTMGAANVTYTATWTINKYTVTWIVDGQETVDTYEYGATIAVPADPAKTGYTFAGWTPDVVTTMGAANVTYTATWTINKYTVTWIVDGQETVDTYEYGATIVVPADPAKTGYTFAGWTPAVQQIMGATDVTYTATFTANSYTITWVANGEVIQTTTVIYDTKIQMSVAAPVKNGYTFMGWYTGENGTGSLITADTTYTVDIMNTAALTEGEAESGSVFFAHYTANSYQVTFDANMGTCDTTSKNVTFDAVYGELPVPTRTGYDFAGWYLNGSEVTSATNVTTANDHTLIAKWTPKTYVIILENEGEESSITVTFGETYASGGLNIPIRSGYIFAGWYHGTQKINLTDTVPADCPERLTAKWELAAYTITYIGVEDGSHSNPGGYDIHDLPLTLTAAARAGYVFQGWTCEELGITTPVQTVVIPVDFTGDLTLRAHYVAAAASVISNGVTTYYVSLMEAWTAAQSGDTIQLLADIAAPGLVIDKDITIDFNNHTYAVNYAIGSTGTETLGLQLLNGYNVVLKNGSLTATYDLNVQGKPVRMLIQNYANLTMDNMVLTANDNTLYCLSINSGNVVVTNSTITAAEGKCAFDACKYGSYEAPVVVATNCTITGIVEVTGGDVTVQDGTYTSNDTDVFVVSSGKLTINGNPTVVGGSRNQSTAVWAKGTGRIVINGGNFTVGADESATGGYNDLIYARDNAIIEIYGGYFDGPARDSDGQKFLLNLKDNSDAQIIVKGGTYIGFDPYDTGTEPVGNNDNFVADGFIAVNDGNNNFTVKAHTHVYNYTVSGNTIIERCTTECRHYAEATLVQDLTVDLTYTGNELKPYHVEYSDGWVGGQLTVSYLANINAGVATAQITCGEATVSATFTITKATLQNVTVNQNGTLVYNTQDQLPGVITTATAVNNQTVVFTFSTTLNGVYTETVPTFKNAGSYTVYYQAVANSHELVSGTFTITIEKAEPEYTIPTGLIAASGCTLSQVTLPNGWSWVVPENLVGQVGERVHKAVFTPEDTDNYKTVTVDVTIRVFQPTITFLNDDGSVITTITQDYGTIVTVPADPSKVGHTFAGWDVEIPVTMPAEDMTITATWTVNEYTVTWIVDGDETTVTYKYGETIEVPADPSKVGHTFTGWTPNVESVMGAENVTYTATWSVNEYTVTWIVDGDETTVTYKYGETIEVPADPSKVGHTFTGWTPNVESVMGAENVTYTATWSVNEYTVTWIVDGDETTVTYKYGETIEVPADPSKVGHTFTGWTPNVESVMGAENVTYTATWSVNEYTVTWIVDGDETTVTYKYGETIEVPADPSKVGHTFTGWTPSVESVMGAENVTYTATWSVNEYTVTWIVDGDETTVTYKYGETIEVPADPSKVGHTFTGWTPNVESVMGAENVTYTATWSVNEYTVTWIVDGDETTVTYKYGETIEVPADPSKVGHTFTGWTPNVESVMGAENVTYTATWSVNEYTVTWIVDGDETTVTYKYGETIEVPADPSKVGHTFTGWTPSVESVMGAENVTYTATWSVNEYTVTWIVDGDETTVTYKYGETIEVPADPSKVGHTFTGWTPSVESVMGAENVTYTATWSVNEYTVTWIVDGDETTVTYKYGETIEVPADPSKVGHTFTGWTPSVESVMGAENVTYTATWSVNEYTVTWIVDGDETTVTYKYGETIEVPADPSKVGYTFTGWDTEIPATMPAENLSFTAMWRYSYTGWLTTENGITYMADGAMAYFDQWATIDTKAYRFDEDGYVITGFCWTTTIDGTAEGWFLFDVATGALKDTYTGLYTAQNGDIYYIENGQAVANKGLVRTVTDENVVEYYYFGCGNSSCRKVACRNDVYTARKSCTHKVVITNDLLPENNYTFDARGVIVHNEDTSLQGIHPDENGVDCYYIDGVKAFMGLIKIDRYYYYVRTNGAIVKNQTYWVSKTNGLMDEGIYEFDSLGRMIIAGEEEEIVKNGVVAEDGSLYYYENGVRTYAGLIELNGAYYYVKTNCEVVHDGIFWITKTNGIMKQGNYEFDAQGRMVIAEPEPVKNGLVEENGKIYYYVNNVKTYAGLIKIDGYYYYIKTDCTAVAGGIFWITKTNGIMKQGNYEFDAQGRMVIAEPEPVKNGLVEENGKIYYYVNNVKTYAGLIMIDGYYYYIKTDCTAVAGGVFWITKTNGIMKQGNYTFDSQGRMVIE